MCPPTDIKHSMSSSIPGKTKPQHNSITDAARTPARYAAVCASSGDGGNPRRRKTSRRGQLSGDRRGRGLLRLRSRRPATIWHDRRLVRGDVALVAGRLRGRGYQGYSNRAGPAFAVHARWTGDLSAKATAMSSKSGMPQRTNVFRSFMQALTPCRVTVATPC